MKTKKNHFNAKNVPKQALNMHLKSGVWIHFKQFLINFDGISVCFFIRMLTQSNLSGAEAKPKVGIWVG